jgi:hypothetical protein
LTLGDGAIAGVGAACAVVAETGLALSALAAYASLNRPGPPERRT